MATSLNTLALFLIALLASGAYAIAQPSDDNGGLQMRSRAVVDTNEQLPSIDEFVELTQEPTWDRTELNPNRVAVGQSDRNTIVAVVIVRALIDSSGNVRECVIDRTDKAMLNEEAIASVRRTHFSPARNGTKAVACWIQVDVAFRLE
jgi:TonB family protein